uniref:Protein kinase domain-containing protein n=1 Tax=Panagrolaimus sp. JU765 TaxID=591449 RepID=A0AC34Q1K1_9BILA
MSLPIFAKKVKKLASLQLMNLKLLINGRGFSKFKKCYKLRGEIGQGGFGIVYSAVRVSDEMPVAVKFIERRHVRDWGKLNDERVPMEICMLARCAKVSGVIKLIDWYSMPEGFLIVMEKPSPCIDLFDFIRRQQVLNEDLTRYLFRQIVQTAIDCAEKKVLHRDLKDENIVIDLLTGETRLIDFGAATLLKKTRYHDFQGTRLYCPPEWFLHSLYLGKEAAVWSLGILLYNMVNGRLPFQNEKHICTSHLLGPLPFYTEVSEELHDLICKCLTFDPFARISLESILKHTWFDVEIPEWIDISANISLNSAERKDSIEEEQQDGKEEEVQDSRVRLTDSRKESGVVSGSALFDENVENGNEVFSDRKTETTAAKEVQTMKVRRNAKTSLLNPPLFVNNAASSSGMNKTSDLQVKSKSGCIRPMLNTRAVQNVASFDSGTSSFGFNCSRDSLHSPLASPVAMDKSFSRFRNLPSIEDCV